MSNNNHSNDTNNNNNINDNMAKWALSTKKANWPPRPLRKVPGNYHGKSCKLSSEESSPKYIQ